MVGERGPELVNLPRGSQVITAHNTRQMLSDAGGGFTYAPNIDARGADAGAVERLEQALQADRATRPAEILKVMHKAKTQRRF
jgi:hypothetical protein